MTDEQLARLRSLRFEVADLSSWHLGEAEGNRIGDLPPGKTVTITYVVRILGATDSINNQGAVSGGNFATVFTDDATVAGPANPTVTLLDSPIPIELRKVTRQGNGHVQFNFTKV